MFGRLREQPPPQTLVGASATPAAGTDTPEGPILLAFAILTLALSAFVLTSAADDALHDPAQKAARGEVKGLGDVSLVREQNLRRVLAKVAAGKRPFVTDIRVAPQRVDVTVRDANGSRKILSIDPALGVKESDFGFGDDAAVTTAKIDAAAPERMLRAVAERSGLGIDSVDYAALSFSGSGPHSWFMALKQGPARTRQWIAAADGSDVRKPGELSQAQKAANAKQRRDIEAAARKLKRTLTRRSACLSRAQDASAASRCIQRFTP